MAPIVPINAIRKDAAGNQRWRKMNRPRGPFVWFEREFLESEAWRRMTLAARSVVDRLCIEHMSHGGTQNGTLIVTYNDFELYGIRRRSIPEAIRLAKYLGFIDITSQGHPSYGIARRPSTYGLTWLPRCDGTPAANRWRARERPNVSTRNINRGGNFAPKAAIKK
jgi:hypothetical protein